jgi:hypothetical protein
VRHWLPGLLLPLFAIPGAYAGDALQAIDDCLSHIDAVADVGYERIAARCPDLTPALAGSPAAAWLPPDWRQPGNALSSRSLGDLRALLVRELTAPAARPTPDTQRVAAVLAAVTETEPTQRGWWARLRAWLHQAMTPREGRANESWLQRWAAGLNLSKVARRLIGGTALALVVGIAVSVIVNELRVAGVLAARERRPRGRVASLAQRGCLSLGDIEEAEASARPSLLFELIASRLAAEQPLPAARALTAGELWRRARLPDEVVRGHLAQLAGVCERLRFSSTPVSPGSLATAVLSGRSVLAALDAVAAPAPASA